MMDILTINTKMLPVFRGALKQLLALLLIGYLISCKKEQDVVTPSSTAQLYIDEIVNYMEAHSINQKTIDWVSFRQQVKAKAQNAQTIPDTYPAIQEALTRLGDNHSFYISANGSTLYGNSSLRCRDVAPAEVPAISKIGYVKINAFSGGGSDATNFAQSIQNAIKAVDNDSIRGWVIDLRGNTGGNMWPMLAGVGPVLGEGIAGHFVDPFGNSSSWSYQGGTAMNDQVVLTKLSTPYMLRKANPKVAVLTDMSTASSGEAIAISFKNRPNTRSFGNPTCGLSTANISTTLSDGATLYLTVSSMADRTKNLYGKSVQPDEVLSGSAAVDKAVNWLLQ